MGSHDAAFLFATSLYNIDNLNNHINRKYVIIISRDNIERQTGVNL